MMRRLSGSQCNPVRGASLRLRRTSTETLGDGVSRAGDVTRTYNGFSHGIEQWRPRCRIHAGVGMDPFVFLCLVMMLATLWYIEAGGNITD